MDLFVVCLLLRRTEIVAADWLIPRSKRLDRTRILRRVDRFMVIRRADTPTLSHRFGIDPGRCEFVFFPAPEATERSELGDSGYFYSAGWAHRDWPTLISALELTGRPAVISCGQQLDAPATVTVLEQLSPDEGRNYLRRARCMVLPLVDTELPSGPLVLLDAMAHGKPVIVSSVGGAVDYVTHGISALMVQAGDVSELVDAIDRIDSDPALRNSLSIGAIAQAAEYTAGRFWQSVLRQEAK
jgi:glycosyltransferase involved in cell wall biosynthesis